MITMRYKEFLQKILEKLELLNDLLKKYLINANYLNKIKYLFYIISSALIIILILIGYHSYVFHIDESILYEIKSNQVKILNKLDPHPEKNGNNIISKEEYEKKRELLKKYIKGLSNDSESSQTLQVVLKSILAILLLQILNTEINAINLGLETESIIGKLSIFDKPSLFDNVSFQFFKQQEEIQLLQNSINKITEILIEHDKKIKTPTEPVCCEINDNKNRRIINVYFQFDDSQLSDGFISEIGDMSSDYLVSGEGLIEIRGHADSVGEENYNYMLSEKRTDSNK